MDLVTLIVTAVAVGAAAGVTDTAKQSVTDAYIALRDLLTHRYREVDLAPLESTPESGAERQSLMGTLRAQGAGTDDELAALATELISAVRAAAAETGAAVGVDLEMVEGAALRISGVTATGTGVRVRDGRFSGDIEIGAVEAGAGDPSHPAHARRPPAPPR
ncbi:hypothetical protein [Nocardia sp. X0981]